MGRSAEDADPAGGVFDDGYCASHSRYFWGLRLHLVATLGGLPILFALTGAKADERETLRDMLEAAPEVAATHPGQTIIGDKNYYGREFENDLAQRHLVLLRPARKGEPERPGAHLFKPLRQVIARDPCRCRLPSMDASDRVEGQARRCSAGCLGDETRTDGSA